MSVFGKKDSGKNIKFGRRLDVSIIKMKVRITMMIKKTANVEREQIDVGIIAELKEWASQKGYSFKTEERKYPIYISGHHSHHQISGTRHRTNLSFSR